MLDSTGGRLLDPTYTAVLLSQYGTGPHRSTFNIMGGTMGVNAMVALNIETGAAAVVIANMSPPAAEQLVPAVLALAGTSQVPTSVP